MSLEGKKIALIGGAGFIGHHLALELKHQGAEVSIVDSLEVNNLLHFYRTSVEIPRRNLYLNFLQERLKLLAENEIPLYIEDGRDYHRLSQALNKIFPDVIVVLAAVAHANRSNKDPHSTFDHSLRTLENALDNTKRIPRHFIYFSSSMVYGDFQDSQVTEETDCRPLGIYGALKYAGEKMVIAYHQVFGIPYTIVRPSALYGPRCVSGRVGQLFIENALSGKEIMINGDGGDSLDFTYIKDLTGGIAKIIENDRAKNEILNLTYGQSRSVADLAGILKKNFSELKIVYQERDKLTPKRGTLSVDKAKNLIGYSPAYPIEKGFLEYLKWYQENCFNFKNNNGRY